MFFAVSLMSDFLFIYQPKINKFLLVFSSICAYACCSWSSCWRKLKWNERRWLFCWFNLGLGWYHNRFSTFFFRSIVRGIFRDCTLGTGSCTLGAGSWTFCWCCLGFSLYWLCPESSLYWLCYWLSLFWFCFWLSLCWFCSWLRLCWFCFGLSLTWLNFVCRFLSFGIFVFPKKEA